MRAHKYSVGKVLVVAGSKGFTGAAVMTALSALRAGAGAVMLAVPESVYGVVARKVSEPIVVPLPSTATGSIAADAIPTLLERLAWCDVAAIGPGLSRHPETQDVVRALLLQSTKSIVLDADGLNLLAEMGTSVVKRSKAHCILTPHAGEFARLTGEAASEVEAGRVVKSRSLARRLGCVVVLKGAPTVTAVPGGEVFVNSTGNPGMATVGAGDVLTGVVAGLWAQGMQEEAAAYGGVFLHGLAGDLARRRLGERSMVAGDIIAMLPSAFQRLERAR
jgi:NAD(P)H-hydrate epimerase